LRLVCSWRNAHARTPPSTYKSVAASLNSFEGKMTLNRENKVF
jgi:hypothetical protein